MVVNVAIHANSHTHVVTANLQNTAKLLVLLSKAHKTQTTKNEDLS
jgi:hypothetical protein